MAEDIQNDAAQVALLQEHDAETTGEVCVGYIWKAGCGFVKIMGAKPRERKT